MRSRPLCLVPLLLAALAWGCSGVGEAGGEAHPDRNANHDSGTTESGAGGHGNGDEGGDRDVWSKPREVFAFLDLGEGRRVIDLMAGNGYNTLILAEIVGTSGRVIAEGGSEDLRGRVLGGDLAGYSQVEFVDGVRSLATASADAVVAVRAYHLFPDVPGVLAELYRALVPGGVVGIVEVRLNREQGHDMQTHRMGEQTVIAEMMAAGFEFVGSSDILRNDDDDHSAYAPPGRTRYMTDRMLLKFRKP